MKIGTILVCAGKGERLGYVKDKPFINLGGQPLFFYSLEVFSKIRSISRIVVVVKKDKFSLVNKYIGGKKKIILAEGGRRRQDSVYQGLKTLGKDIDYVVIHDGARPFITKNTVQQLLVYLKRYPAVTLGLPIREAVKLVDKGVITRSVDRENLYLIQTPQGFKRSLLSEAYRRFGNRDVYDETELVEQLGKKVKVLAGDIFNIKITYPQDLVLARTILERRRNKGSRLKFKIQNRFN